MRREDLMKALEKSRPSASIEARAAVASDLTYSGITVEEALGDDSLLERMFKRFEERKNIEADSLKIIASDPTKCPICKIPLVAVKLDHDRPAVYCNRHFVVYPTKV